MAKRNASLGVDWHLPKRGGGYQARRFATTTVATSTLIEALAADGLSVRQAHDAIHYDDDGKNVLARLVTEGYGETPLARFVRAR